MQEDLSRGALQVKKPQLRKISLKHNIIKKRFILENVGR